MVLKSPRVFTPVFKKPDNNSTPKHRCALSPCKSAVKAVLK